jgi:hypothetical protein
MTAQHSAETDVPPLVPPREPGAETSVFAPGDRLPLDLRCSAEPHQGKETKRLFATWAQRAAGGRAVNSIIGTFCRLFANGPNARQLTHGIADEILRDLGTQGAARPIGGPMTIAVYRPLPRRPRAGEKVRGSMLFRNELRWITPLLWLAYTASSMAVFFSSSWGPTILMMIGYSRSTSAVTAASLNILAVAVRSGAATREEYRPSPGWG